MKNKENNYLGAFAILCLIVSTCLFIIFVIANNNERQRFLNFNRSTVPIDFLEQIYSPLSLTLSFNQYYHLDSIQLYDNYGNQVLNLSTVCYKFEGVDYSSMTAENYYFMSTPYNLTIDNEQYSVIRTMEDYIDYSFDTYRKEQFPDSVTTFDYLLKGLPNKFFKKVYQPLLQTLFDKTLYVRTSSSESIIKAIRLNQLGTIRSIHLYNGLIIDFEDDATTNDAYMSLTRSYFNDESKKKIVEFYKYRLGKNSLSDYNQEALSLANKHIEEIVNTLKSEKIGFLCVKDDYNLTRNEKDREQTYYPMWIEDVLCFGILTFTLFIIFSIVVCIRYNRSSTKNL